MDCDRCGKRLKSNHIVNVQWHYESDSCKRKTAEMNLQKNAAIAATCRKEAAAPVHARALQMLRSPLLAMNPLPLLARNPFIV